MNSSQAPSQNHLIRSVDAREASPTPQINTQPMWFRRFAFPALSRRERRAKRGHFSELRFDLDQQEAFPIAENDIGWLG
jgi:hypothetical protein